MGKSVLLGMKKKQCSQMQHRQPPIPAARLQRTESEKATEPRHCAATSSTSLMPKSPFQDPSLVEEALRRYPGTKREFVVLTYLALMANATQRDYLQSLTFMGRTNDDGNDPTPMLAAAYYLAGDIKRADEEWGCYQRMKREGCI